MTAAFNSGDDSAHPAKAAINKRAVAQSFSRAARQYDQVASLQMQVGTQLLSLVEPATEYEVALDIGCGTGRLTRQLTDYCDILIALDVAPGMLQFARDRHGAGIAHFVCADADALPFADESLDLVFSNFALQWCESLPLLLGDLFRILRPGGQLLFSVPGEHTLQELKQSWQKADPSHAHVNDFPTVLAVQAAVQNAGFNIECLHADARVVQHGSVGELTRELKTLGAHTVNGARNRQLTGKHKVAAMLKAYETLRTTDGMLPATWDIISVRAGKPPLSL